ncbi:hypothetical protein BKA63DRAFT_564997 [Paraphoma chrysanthemicola]|nr:hypothetical protein BKA63DRAFT_564997 [Paraphoma chrysanthemicola]
MSLFSTLLVSLHRTLLYIAIKVSQFESETLHIPHAVCFFTKNAGPDHAFRQAFLFHIALLHAFFTIPMMDMVVGPRQSSLTRGLLRYGGLYLLLLSTFWATIVLNRHFA